MTYLNRITTLTAVALVAALTLTASAKVYTWQGGTGNWGDANWDEDGTPNGSIDSIADPVEYNNDTFHILTGEVNRAGQITFGGATGGATMNVGGTGTWNYNENDQLQLRADGLLNIFGNGVVNLNRTPNGSNSLNGGNDSYLAVSGNGQLLSDDVIQLFWTEANISDTAYVRANRLYLQNPSTNVTVFNFHGGTIDLVGAEADNPFRLPNGVGSSGEASLNFTGDSGVLRLPNASTAYIAGSKLGAGFIRIDGQDPGGTGSSNSVNGKYFDADVEGSLVLVQSGTYREAVLDGANPLAYYRLEEQAGATRNGDYSGHTNDAGGVTNGASGVAGYDGNGISLSGADSYFDTSVSLDPTSSDFSIEMFVNPSVLSAGTALVQQLDGSGLGRTILVLSSDGSLNSFLGGSTQAQTASGVLEVGKWAHVVLTGELGAGVGGDDLISIYVDGILAATGEETFEAATGIWRIGAQKTGTTAEFAGLIDEIAIYDRALSSTEVVAHAQAAGIPTPAALPAGLGLMIVTAARRKRRR